MKDDYTTNSQYITYTFLFKSRENVPLSQEVKSLKSVEQHDISGGIFYTTFILLYPQRTDVIYPMFAVGPICC